MYTVGKYYELKKQKEEEASGELFNPVRGKYKYLFQVFLQCSYIVYIVQRHIFK